VTTLTLTVRRNLDGWTIAHTSDALVTDIVNVDDSDIRNVLADAEQMASGDVLWRAHACGFDAVIGKAGRGNMPICPNCSAVTEYCGHCGARLGD
jgi:hypothetical protein